MTARQPVRRLNRPEVARRTTSKRRVARRRGERHALLLSRRPPETEPDRGPLLAAGVLLCNGIARPGWATNAPWQGLDFQGIGRSTRCWLGDRRVAGADRFRSAPDLIGVRLRPTISLTGCSPEEPASASPDHCLIHDQMKQTQSRVEQGRPHVSHRRGEQRGSCGEVFPVSVSLRPYRERETETMTVSA